MTHADGVYTTRSEPLDALEANRDPGDETDAEESE